MPCQLGIRLTSSMRAAVGAWGQRMRFLSTSSRVTVLSICRYSSSSTSSSLLEVGMWILPTDETNATISIP